MHGQARRSTGYNDGKVNALARDVQRSFDAILDTTTHRVVLVWAPPHDLAIPFFGGDKRLSTPQTVRCDRAKDLTEPSWSTTPGGVSWDWRGGGQVHIYEVSGLIEGHNYELTFTVVG